jgi:acyl-CoA thioester hydrolase
MLRASVDIRVRYKETDKMGVVYHSNYFTWFEIARIALLDDLGCPYADLEKDGFFLPVLSCDATFHQPAFFDDRLTVDVRIEKVPTVRIEALYEIRKKGELITSGSTNHAFVSQKGGVVRPPAKFAEVARSFFNN